MKKLAFTVALIALFVSASAQHKIVDSLRARLNTSLDDSTRINTMLDLGHTYYLSNPDSNIIISQQAYTLAEKSK